ncbi:MAG: nucleoside triphosphate pyrophosphohydrolase [Thermodesulfobacteriota bacterium]|nr:nucleoside triphosphate pyrophosphohydrolase [Thermodesulfobacteriota bacterium]
MEINSIIDLIEILRGENGCPWDRKQTPGTIAVYLLEEVYELVDAIESKDPDGVCEELGDVLFHILFLSGLFREMGHFDIKDVIDFNVEKMTRRHPHVFGNERVDSVEEVRARWHQIKKEEKSLAKNASILDSVPVGFPALMRAYRVSERAAKTGFDWNDISGVMQKVEEEWSELKTVLKRENRSPKDQDLLVLEFGDVLFTLVNVARFAHIHPETALRNSIKKFEKRFKYMEKLITESRRNIESVPQVEKDELWEEAKANLTVS